MRLENKIKKIRRFWRKESLLVPNVFRLVSAICGERRFILEYLDLSKKELLGRPEILTKVQANGQKAMDKQAKNAMRSTRRPRRADQTRRVKTEKPVNKKMERASATTGPSENSGSLAQGGDKGLTEDAEVCGELLMSTAQRKPGFANVGSSLNFNPSV